MLKHGPNERKPAEAGSGEIAPLGLLVFIAFITGFMTQGDALGCRRLSRWGKGAWKRGKWCERVCRCEKCEWLRLELEGRGDALG